MSGPHTDLRLMNARSAGYDPYARHRCLQAIRGCAAEVHAMHLIRRGSRQYVLVSTSAAHYRCLYTEALRDGCVGGFKDAAGFPAPKAADGVRAGHALLVAQEHAERVIETVPAYAGFEPVEIPRGLALALAARSCRQGRTHWPQLARA